MINTQCSVDAPPGQLSISALAVLILAAVAAPGWAEDRGGALYEQHCAPCHGIDGDGQGEAAYLLSPKPRDFTGGLYKLRSTPTGSPPTDADLLLTLRRGVAGTAMPAWDRLADEDLAAIVEHLKTFAPEWFEDDDPEPPIAIGTAPAASPESLKAGAEVFERMKCAECHGPRGRGDGPSAATLRDDWRRPIRPYDFTRGATSMKGGAAAADIYRTFMTGMAGTPMPAYADLLSAEQGWQLVHFVQSLWAATDAPAIPQGTPALQAVEVTGDLPLDPDDAAWESIPATLVPLRPLWARDQRVEAVAVRAAVGADTVALRLEWRDPESDMSLVRHEDFRDAVAVQFAPDAEPGDYVGLPFIGMGDADATVAVWHWKADWDADVASGTFRDVGEQYAAMFIDQPDPRADNTMAPLFLTGLAAGNAFSARQRRTPVEALVAKGFGTLTSLPQDEQTVEGRGVWRDGVWSVVMRRKLESDAPPALRRGRTHTIAVAVWDGGAGDRDGQKVISQWMELATGGQSRPR